MDLNIQEIYDALLAGEEVVALVPVYEVANFRTKLYRLKKKQEDQMVGIEIMSNSELQQLSFTTKEWEDDYEFVEVTLKLKPRPRNTTFTILSRKAATE